MAQNSSWKIYGATVKNDPSVCCYCGVELNEYSRTVDHLIPESRGGIRANKNKLNCCGDCNKLKGNMTPEEFQRAVCAMMRLEGKNHRQRIGYLKKIKKNLNRIIESKSGESKDGVQPPPQ
jgi:CRISPR/Cas system Type II protein with McrA/HNH and RuvC-like nuclease domain